MDKYSERMRKSLQIISKTNMLDKSIINKEYLTENYNKILHEGPLSIEEIETFLRTRKIRDDIIIQSTSGSTGIPLLIPRTKSDIRELANRILKFYIDEFNKLPQKVALLGGISHSETALKLKVQNIDVRSLSLDELDELFKFDPDVISCYPSISRELVIQDRNFLPNLKMLKLGGEPVYSSDIKKIRNRFASIIIVEQYGSTEMPGLAFKNYKGDLNNTEFILQYERFSYLINEKDGWQPLIVKDKFSDLLFPIKYYYNTGDEVFIQTKKVKDVRRKGDISHKFKNFIEESLDNGCTNIQIDLNRNTIYYNGKMCLPDFILLDKTRFKTEFSAPKRLKTSNKLPVIIN